MRLTSNVQNIFIESSIPLIFTHKTLAMAKELCERYRNVQKKAPVFRVDSIIRSQNLTNNWNTRHTVFSTITEAQKARGAQVTKRRILIMRSGEGCTEKMTQSLTLEGRVGYRLTETGVKGIPGNCINKGKEAGTCFFLIALEEELHLVDYSHSDSNSL